MQILIGGLLGAMGMEPPPLDESRFNPVAGNAGLYLLLLILAWTTIAFGEEMIFRAFLITRLADGAEWSGKWAILTSGLLFGMVHFVEGPVGMASNAAFGILFGAIYWRTRNLWITVIGHGFLNTFRFTLIFLSI